MLLRQAALIPLKKPSKPYKTLYAHRPTAIDITEEKRTPHYTVELTSDAFADPFIIRDNTVPYGEDGQYYDVDGIYQTFETEEEAQEYADTLNSAENIVKLFAQKDEERSQQEQPDIQDNSDLIGKEILIDNRRYVIESISEISGDVSMRDITFADAVGFPINRVEKVGYVRKRCVFCSCPCSLRATAQLPHYRGYFGCRRCKRKVP